MVDINQAQPSAAAPSAPTGAPTDTTGQGLIAALIAQIRAKIKIPANLKDAYKRIVSAGLKIMFDAKTHKMVLDTINAGGDLGKNIGEGAAGLVFLIYKQAKNPPPQLMIPAGMEFVLQAFEYIEKTQLVPYTPANLSTAIKVMTRTVLQQSGANVSALDKAMGASPQAPPGAPPAPGMIANKMGGA